MPETSPVILVDEPDGPEEYCMVEHTAAVDTPEAAVAAALEADYLPEGERMRFECEGSPVWLAPDPDDEHGEQWIPADESTKDAMLFWRVDLTDEPLTGEDGESDGE